MEGGERVCLSCIRRDIIRNVSGTNITNDLPNLVLYKIKREKLSRVLAR